MAVGVQFVARLVRRLVQHRVTLQQVHTPALRRETRRLRRGGCCIRFHLAQVRGQLLVDPGIDTLQASHFCACGQHACALDLFAFVPAERVAPLDGHVGAHVERPTLVGFAAMAPRWLLAWWPIAVLPRAACHARPRVSMAQCYTREASACCLHANSCGH